MLGSSHSGQNLVARTVLPGIFMAENPSSVVHEGAEPFSFTRVQPSVFQAGTNSSQKNRASAVCFPIDIRYIVCEERLCAVGHAKVPVVSFFFHFLLPGCAPLVRPFPDCIFRLSICRIHLRGCGIQHGHHGLNSASHRPVAQKMCRKGMAQGVRCDIFLDSCTVPVILDDLPKALTAHFPAVVICKQKLRVCSL